MNDNNAKNVFQFFIYIHSFPLHIVSFFSSLFCWKMEPLSKLVYVIGVIISDPLLRDTYIQKASQRSLEPASGMGANIQP